MQITTGPAVAGAVGAIALAALLGCASTAKKDASDTMGTGSEFSEGAEPFDDADEVSLETSLQTIYFDFDRSEIREDAKPMLRSNAESIRANQGWGLVRVEGHCDERGSEEYNLALGERRAASVRDYLVDLGVPAARLETVSFGESKPAVMGHDESAWRWNRRSEFSRVR